MKSSIIQISIFIFLWISCINGCKKDETITPPPTVIKTSFTQEFDRFTSTQYFDWKFYSDLYSSTTPGWRDASVGLKEVNFYSLGFGFSPPTDSYYAVASRETGKMSIVNMWMISPAVEMKNGDRLSFYVKGDTLPTSHNRLQVRLNSVGTDTDVLNGGSSESDVGHYTILVADIGENTPMVFPKTWTKMEYVVSGLPNTIITRIAFRYYVPPMDCLNEGSIGVDLFQFEKS